VFPPQDAETVFARRLGVCAGYARLLAALGDAAGEEIVVIGGDARTRGSDVTGESHAWNAARIDDTWHLIDATWDSGSLDDGGNFEKQYSAAYLFAPPEVFVVSHFPEQENWQLLATPVSRGEFFRRPMMRADFFAQGLELIRPDRSQVSVDEVFELAVKNPRGLFFMATYAAADGTRGDCEVTQGATAAARCALPVAGTYQVDLYAAPQRFGSYPSVGAFEVLRRG
jgi:transglutaminase/protease-like cytokinesis protein 3